MAISRTLDRNLELQRIRDYDEMNNGLFEMKTAEFVPSDNNEETAERSSNEDEDEQLRSESEAESEGGNFDRKISNVSFGALLQAQDSLSRKRKRGSDTAAIQNAKFEAIRTRLQQIRSQKENTRSSDTETTGETKAIGSSHTKRLNRSIANDQMRNALDTESESESDLDSPPSEEERTSKSRSSKHAPTTQSSKHQVTRKRTVIDVPKRVSRDPRFDALNQSSTHPGSSEKAYSFLRDYQKDEISELKAAIKKARSEEDKETLKRKVVSMENRLKAKEAKEREQDVLRRHRKEEKEKVEQGKKPFFLKTKDLKEKAQIERFKNMKKKDQERLLEKRRRKESQKEMKSMPEGRRLTR